MRVRPRRARAARVNAILDTQVVISGATLGMLTLGRFVFLPFQRRKSAQAAQYPKARVCLASCATRP
jgi:hypothetical protein